jgi:alpha-mannosidase
VQRPTTFNHSWEIAKFEVVGHQYADLSEHNFGVALLNDCKYGYSVRDSVMRLSLLRASKSPDDCADMGHHTFTYSIMPHWQAFPVRSVIEEAADLNWGPQAHAVSQEMSRSPGSLVKVLGGGGLDSVVISAVKRSERQADAIVIRAYESLGGRGSCGLGINSYASIKAVHACNMLEEKASDAGEISVRKRSEIWLSFSPFQIRTVLIVLE